MSGMWNRTLVYLGLREEPEDFYDDDQPQQFAPEDESGARPAPPRPSAAPDRRPATSEPPPSRPAPGEARAARLARSAGDEDGDSNVRPLHGHDAAPRGATARSRTSVIELSTFDEVEGVGARYRTGQPVLFDLSGADTATARRVVDFVSGMTYAMRGEMTKVGSRAFLLTPSGESLSDEERRRLSGLGFRFPVGGDA